jgi:hypothetical protein
MKRLGLALLVVGLSACNAVKPYQRELLTLPGMSLEASPASDVRQHMLEAREASFGGYGASGGGCGCN